MKGFVCHKSIFSNFYERLWKFFVGFQLSRSISNYIALLSLFVQFHFVQKIIKFRFSPATWDHHKFGEIQQRTWSSQVHGRVHQVILISIKVLIYQYCQSISVCWLHTLWMSLGWFVLFICKFLISMQI